MNKVVLVTGSAIGIGAAIIKELSSAGYSVVINYLTSEKEALSLQEEIQKTNPFVMAIQADVSKEEEVDQMFNQIEKRFGSVDILINNAAVDLSDVYSKQTVEDFQKTLDVNLLGAYITAKRAYKKMYEKNYGRIINITSTNGINTYCSSSCFYDASKAALISLTHNLAFEYAPIIHVNGIAPGFIGTENELKGYTEDFLKEEVDKIMLKRYGTPEDVAHLVKFLISDDADYINNTIIRIDGGQLNSN